MAPPDELPAERPLITFVLREKEALKITAEQEQKLRALRADFERELARREAEVRVAEVNVRELLAAETPDLAKVEPEVKRIAALRGETRFRRIQTIQNGLAVLTKEQRQHLARHERHVAGGMMGGGMSMGRGRMAPGGMMGHGSQSGGQPGAGAAPAAPGQAAPQPTPGTSGEHRH